MCRGGSVAAKTEHCVSDNRNDVLNDFVNDLSVARACLLSDDDVDLKNGRSRGLENKCWVCSRCYMDNFSVDNGNDCDDCGKAVFSTTDVRIG